RDGDVIFTGDAAKNRVELLTREADATYDKALTARTIEAIWALWKRRPDTILVPGHDLPMKLHEGRPVFLGKREAAIAAWFGDDLETTTLLQLVA
ncbi:MAG: N-acyl homoserine lactonase family protein, partial [Burkholderiales bacterium]